MKHVFMSHRSRRLPIRSHSRQVFSHQKWSRELDRLGRVFRLKGSDRVFLLWGSSVVGFIARQVASDILTEAVRPKSMENKAQKKKSRENPRPAELLYTSHTRDIGFQYERHAVTFFGWTNCAYKVSQFSYRRFFEVGLNRRNRFGSQKSRRASSRRTQFAT